TSMVDLVYCYVIEMGLILLIFFFFQAEDGIRYRTVTGVQTCALPILPAGTTPFPFSSSSAGACASAFRWHGAFIKNRRTKWRPKIGRASCRKECRSRWSWEL